MQPWYLTRFEAMFQNKLQVFVARALKGDGIFLVLLMIMRKVEINLSTLKLVYRCLY